MKRWTKALLVVFRAGAWLRHALALTSLLFATVTLVSCAASTHQTATDRVAVLSTVQVGQRVKVSFNDPRGWSTSTECTVEFRNDEGMSCGLDFLFYERVTSISLETSGDGMNYALVPLMPIAVAAWVAASMVCPPDTGACRNDKRDVSACNVSFADIMRTEKATRVVLVSEPVSVGVKYKHDGLADTVEIVTWKPEEKGRSHIEDDGEVIYLAPGSPEKAKRQLVQEAMFYKTVASKNLKAQCSGPWYANSRNE